MSFSLYRNSLPRRTFLGASFAVSTAAFTGVAQAAVLEKSRKWDKTYDVVVVGGGLAGMSAALSAKENGAKQVVILEKGSFMGGHALVSGGGFVACGTKIQKAAGIDDSAEECWNDAVARGLALTGVLQRDPAVAKVVFDNQTAALEWLQGHGVVFEEKPGYGYGNKSRIHYFAPKGTKGNSAAMQKLQEAVDRAGVEVLMQTRLTRLLSEAEAIGSRVCGVLAQGADGKEIAIEAKSGVVLACGGFGADAEMLKHYHPYLEGITVLGSPLATGDGFKAAAELGAPLLVTHNDLGGTFSNVEATGKQVRVSGFAPANLPLLMVNKDGRRFIDETRGGRYITSTMVEKGIKEATVIIDGKNKEEAKNNWFRALFSAPGLVREYNSIGELAGGEKIDAEGLMATIKQFNQDVSGGKDSVFGREKLLQTFDTPPFCAFTGAPSLLYTYSGLEIDTETHVLNTMLKPIPGLYAAGDAGGRLDAILGLGQGGTSGLSDATVTGRIAGRNAAKKL